MVLLWWPRVGSQCIQLEKISVPTIWFDSVSRISDSPASSWSSATTMAITVKWQMKAIHAMRPVIGRHGECLRWVCHQTTKTNKISHILGRIFVFCVNVNPIIVACWFLKGNTVKKYSSLECYTLNNNQGIFDFSLLC